MDGGPSVHLVSVADTFHARVVAARVVAARLGSDGTLTELRARWTGRPLVAAARVARAS